MMSRFVKAACAAAILVLAPCLAQAQVWQPKGGIILYPKERQVAEGSALPIRLKPVCKYSCPKDEISYRLDEAQHVIVWRVNGIEGGNDKIGVIEQTVTDSDGRMTSVTYVAPKEVDSEMTVEVSATINRKGGPGQVTYVSRLTIVPVTDWSGWVHVSFKGMRDEYASTSADRNWEWWKGDRPDQLYASPDLANMPMDVSWLEFEVHHTITYSMANGDDDTGEAALLIGGVSGELNFYNRTQAVGCTDWSYTELSGKIIDYGPESRPIPYITALKTMDGAGKRVLHGPTVNWIPGVVFEFSGQEIGELCTGGYYEDVVPPEIDNFGTAPEPIEDTDPTYGDACLDTYTGVFDQTIRFRGEDIPGKTTISWCLSRR